MFVLLDHDFPVGVGGDGPEIQKIGIVMEREAKKREGRKRKRDGRGEREGGN